MEDAGHVLQLAAYCLLVEDNYGYRPPYGYLRYADATIQIPYTNELRAAVLTAMRAMRKARTAADVSRSHEDAGRCQRCGYLASCGPQALAGAPPHLPQT
jgi:CRISPR-associated exonuclease Cas4